MNRWASTETVRHRTPTRVVAALAISGTLLVLGASIAPVPFMELVNDPLATGALHPLTGSVSTLGIIGWLIAGGFSLGSAASRLGGVRPIDAVKRVDRTGMLFGFGALSCLLGIDDITLFHEQLAPVYFRLPQNLVLASYALLAVAIVIRFRAEIVTTDLYLFGAAVMGFTFSVATDVLDIGTWSEDAAKFVGLVCWVFWLVDAARLPSTD